MTSGKKEKRTEGLFTMKRLAFKPASATDRIYIPSIVHPCQEDGYHPHPCCFRLNQKTLIQHKYTPCYKDLA